MFMFYMNLEAIRALEGILGLVSVKWSAQLLARIPNLGKILKKRGINGGTITRQKPTGNKSARKPHRMKKKNHWSSRQQFFKNSTEISCNFWCYFLSYTNTCKYANHTYYVTVPRSTKIELPIYQAWATCGPMSSNKRRNK